MKKIKTSELIGPALDWAVLKALNLNEEDYVEIDNLYGPIWRGPEYSTDWAQGGPIIERERIELIRWDGTWGVEEGTWVANIQHEDKRFGGVMRSEGQGTTPLIAAMRCYVASKLGDEVEIPEELK